MPQRNIEGQYPYAYQGQEKDAETGMEAFELRLWDARLGRWLTTDPYGQFSSPYLGMGNNPISMIDPDGGKSGPGCTGCPTPALQEFITSITTPVSSEFSWWESKFVEVLPEVVVNGKTGFTKLAQNMIDFIHKDIAYQSIEWDDPERFKVRANLFVNVPSDIVRDSPKGNVPSVSAAFRKTRDFRNINFDENYDVIDTNTKDNRYVLLYLTGNRIEDSNWDGVYSSTHPESLSVSGLENTRLGNHQASIMFKGPNGNLVSLIAFKTIQDKHSFVTHFENLR